MAGINDIHPHPYDGYGHCNVCSFLYAEANKTEMKLCADCQDMASVLHLRSNLYLCDKHVESYKESYERKFSISLEERNAWDGEWKNITSTIMRRRSKHGRFSLVVYRHNCGETFGSVYSDPEVAQDYAAKSIVAHLLLRLECAR